MTKIYLVHKKTGKEYQLLKLDKEAGTMTLQGPNATFEEPYDPERLKQRGYTVRKETSDAQQQEL